MTFLGFPSSSRSHRRSAAPLGLALLALIQVAAAAPGLARPMSPIDTAATTKRFADQLRSIEGRLADLQSRGAGHHRYAQFESEFRETMRVYGHAGADLRGAAAYRHNEILALRAKLKTAKPGWGRPGLREQLRRAIRRLRLVEAKQRMLHASTERLKDRRDRYRRIIVGQGGTVPPKDPRLGADGQAPDAFKACRQICGRHQPSAGARAWCKSHCRD